jgi:hypothetical protein
MSPHVGRRWLPDWLPKYRASASAVRHIIGRLRLPVVTDWREGAMEPWLPSLVSSPLVRGGVTFVQRTKKPAALAETRA